MTRQFKWIKRKDHWTLHIDGNMAADDAIAMIFETLAPSFVTYIGQYRCGHSIYRTLDEVKAHLEGIWRCAFGEDGGEAQRKAYEWYKANGIIR